MSISAAHYRGDQRFSVEQAAQPPGPGQVQIDVAFCGTDRHPMAPV